MTTASKALEVGAHAPDIVLRDGDGTTLIARTLGRPRVLAFVRDWGMPRQSELEPIRAQLRGIGAELTVLSERGAWTFKPDDAIEQVCGASHLLAVGVAAVARVYGVHGGRDAVFVIGTDAVIRFAHVPKAPLGRALGDALARAVDAMHRGRTPPVTFTRREWATSCLVSGFAVALFSACRGSTSSDPPAATDPAPATPRIDDVNITLEVNGTKHPLAIDPRMSLLDALRERLGLTGTKKGCDAGQCGACTVHLGDRRVLSCLTLAAMAEGQPVTTIEGLATSGHLHPMQQAFITQDAFQCGFCTPGQIMSAVALVRENRAHTDDEIREQMSGNICRCGAYPNIVAAVRIGRRV